MNIVTMITTFRKKYPWIMVDIAICLLAFIYIGLFSMLYAVSRMQILFIFIALIPYAAVYFAIPFIKIFSSTTPYHGKYHVALEHMAVENHIKIKLIGIAQTKVVNAYAIGMANARAIILTSALLDHSSWDEIEGVFAHELGHQAHNDGIFLAAVVASISLVCVWINGVLAVQQMPAIVIFFVVLLEALLCTNGYLRFSRTREAMADTYAKQILKKHEGFIAYFEKRIAYLLTLGHTVESMKKFKQWYLHPFLADRIAYFKKKEI